MKMQAKRNLIDFLERVKLEPLGKPFKKTDKELLRMTNLTSENTSSKVNWQGKIVSIQPRTRVWRYVTDNRTHYHLGYNFFIEGHSSDSKKQFTVAISEKQQIKGLYQIGDVLEGTACLENI